MEYIVLSEISKKQDYIFKSNKLKENIGASLIIKYLTEQFPKTFLEQNNGEKVFEGGGKSLYKFSCKDNAVNFVKQLTKETFVHYAGVEMFIVIQELDMKQDDVIERIDEAYTKLAIKKNERRNSAKQISYGINKLCRSTQLPASTYSRDGNPISAEIQKKIEFSNKDTENFQHLLPEGYHYKKEFDELISGDEKSFIAVVHIDGNLMGKKINAFKERHNQKKNNRSIQEHNEDYLNRLSKLSADIAAAYEKAFTAMCSAIADSKDILNDELNMEGNTMPIRPLIIAGDDISYVANAKIGIESAKVFIEQLSNEYLEIDEGMKMQLNACAGVAIVKSHYPFSRAYNLAEELCKSAKSSILKEFPEEDYSVIDWHISHGEISGSLDVIRNSYYKNNGVQLNMKPLYINNKNTWKTYDNFLQAFKAVTDEKVPRNKMKELREVFRQGRERSELYITVNQLEQIIYRFSNVQGEYGFTDSNVCMYFDAIEALDLFLRLHTKEGVVQ